MSKANHLPQVIALDVAMELASIVTTMAPLPTTPREAASIVVDHQLADYTNELIRIAKPDSTLPIQVKVLAKAILKHI
jgi:hypothetical protein